MEATIVLYAAPGMGHIVSMVELGKLLLRRYPDQFSITILYTHDSFVDTPSIPSYICRISTSHPSISFRRFPRVEMPTALQQTHSGAAIIFDFICLNAPHVGRALHDIVASFSSIRAFIIDIFCTSAVPVAAEFGIPTSYFHTSGAAALAVFLYFPKIWSQTVRVVSPACGPNHHLEPVLAR